jgi:hypothetical protein
VIIKVDLGILKVLVGAHGSRVEFVQADDGKIFSGPFSVILHWNRLQACDYVTGMHYHGTSKETCQERDRTRYG